MGKPELIAMQAQDEACQKGMMAVMIGTPIPVIMAALTTITGGMIGTSAPNLQEARRAAAQVAHGMMIVAESCFEEGPANG